MGPTRRQGAINSAAALLIFAGVAAACGDDDVDVVFDDDEAVFDFEQNTLCDWFTADQMETIVAEAMERAGVRVEVESFSTSGECRMAFAATRGAIWDTPGWRSQSDGGLGIDLAPVATDPRGEALRSTDPADFEGHSVLDDAVTYGNLSFGFAYSHGVQAQLLVEGHEDEVLFLGFGVEGDALDQTAGSEQATFALSVADIMLAEMNWTD